jgi:hypothetical protein
MQTATREQRSAAGRIAGCASARSMTREQRHERAVLAGVASRAASSIRAARRTSQAAEDERLRVERLKARRQEIEDNLLARVRQITGNVLR